MGSLASLDSLEVSLIKYYFAGVLKRFVMVCGFDRYLDFAFRSSHLLSTFKRRVLKKISTIHGKTPVLEFLVFSFNLIFQKRDFQ